MKRLSFLLRTAAFAALIALCLTGQTKTHVYGPHEKAFYADKALVDFVSPGLGITINSASIATNGTITMTYTLTDPNGLPLDAAGVNTPGAISLAYVAAYIPKGQEQYVAYTTAQATGKVLGTITRPDFELGSPATQVAPGQYQYTFTAKASAGFDPTLTNTVAVNGNRDLTAFNLGTNYAGATFNFVPNGAAVTVTRDVIRTQSCNTCHDSLAFHGGYAQGMQTCVLCHQPQNADPSTGNSLDAKVFFHSLHMGSSLPTVVGTKTTPGVPYEIIGYMNSVNNFSNVIDPAMAQRCEVCHSQTHRRGASQSLSDRTKPRSLRRLPRRYRLRDWLSSWPEVNHPGGPQADDTQCTNCHIPQGEMPFDASIMGAHVVPTDTAATYPQNPDTLLAGINLAITSVTHTSAGQTPTVNFTVQDDKGNNIPLSRLRRSAIHDGRAYDGLRLHEFRNRHLQHSRVRNGKRCDGDLRVGRRLLLHVHARHSAGATGTYSMGGEARMTVTVLPGTTARRA